MTSITLKPNSINNYANYNSQASVNYKTENVFNKYLPSYALLTVAADSFVSNFCKPEKVEKFKKLFPNNELMKIYNKINKDFGIDEPATLNIFENSDSKVGGYYNFAKNEIRMNMADLIDADTKIVGVKNGKKTILLSNFGGLPLFLNKKDALDFLNKQTKNGNLGFDRLILEPVTAKEHRKYIIQKITHEVVHSQQHMIMRKSGNVGVKAIIKAWANSSHKNILSKILFGITAYLGYKFYYDSDKENGTSIYDIAKNANMDDMANNWLKAINSYSAVDTNDYAKNVLEIDANQQAELYIKHKYGGWN